MTDRRRTLRADRAGGYVRVEWATLGADGTLRIEGQSVLSGDQLTGYEWAFTLPPAQVPAVLAALNADPADDVLEALQSHCADHYPPDFIALFQNHDIEYDFQSRGD